MKNHTLFALALTSALVLTACGGGSDDSSTGTGAGAGTGTGTGTTTPPSASNPVNVAYTDYYRLQDLATAGTSATFTDKGVGGAGSVGVRGQTITMVPSSDGGIGYGAPVTKGVAVGSNTADTNLPAIAMLCQAAAVGDGMDGQKSIDVLVANSATRVTTAAALEGQTLGTYREDCAVVSASRVVVDASGNATIVTQDETLQVSAADLTRYLGGALMPVGNGNGSAALVAYSYKKVDGSNAYAVVFHASPAGTTGLTRADLGLWSQQ